MSRLGRDHIEIVIFLERYFPDNDIRYIAVNDNVDTNEELDDFIPIKSIVNELYAKDISKKIRATQKFQRETGAFRGTSSKLYGYALNEYRTKRIPNPETAPVVYKIFEMVSKGYYEGRLFCTNKNEMGVNLLTIHKAKGLEFKCVFIISLNDVILPSNLNDNNLI